MPPARQWRSYPQTYRLEAGRCKGCGKVFFPPRLVCDSCRGREFETFRMKRTAVGIVEMDDGVRLTTQIVDADLEEVKIGMPVKMEFRRIYEEGDAGTICYGVKAVPVRQ